MSYSIRVINGEFMRDYLREEGIWSVNTYWKRTDDWGTQWDGFIGDVDTLDGPYRYEVDENIITPYVTKFCDDLITKDPTIVEVNGTFTYDDDDDVMEWVGTVIRWTDESIVVNI